MKTILLKWPLYESPIYRSLTVTRIDQISRVFGLVLHVKSKHRMCASFCYLSNIDIFQYVTRCSTCTRQNTSSCLDDIHMYTLVLDIHACIKVTLTGELAFTKPG